MSELMAACEAWKRQPDAAHWQTAKAAALDLIRRCGELPKGSRQQDEAAARLLEVCGVSVSAALEAW